MQYLILALPELHGRAYKRVTFYFPKGDEAAIEDYLVMPDHKRPSEIRDMSFKFCGRKLKKSTEFEKFVDETVPTKFHDRFAKSEKGIDIEICCDGLKLASASRVSRLFLFSNDGDFIPFCRTLKEFGANISIIHLSSIIAPNVELLREADSYDVVPTDRLSGLFLPVRTEPPTPFSDDAALSAEKPTVAIDPAKSTVDSANIASESEALEDEPEPADSQGPESSDDEEPKAAVGVKKVQS